MSMSSERQIPPAPESQRTDHEAGNGALIRFFGGPPLTVVFRLILLSILIGVILHATGLDPLNILESLRILLVRVWDMGFDAVRWLWRYLVLGAAVVVPVWVFLRLTRIARGR